MPETAGRSAREVDQRLRQERRRRVLTIQRDRLRARGIAISSSAEAVVRSLIGDADRRHADGAAPASSAPPDFPVVWPSPADAKPEDNTPLGVLITRKGDK